MTRQVPRSGCPINGAVEVFGDRWTLIVLRDIVFGDRRYFRELLTQSDEGIASNILSDRLARLVDSGLLTRDNQGRGRRARYSLTESAIQLVPVLAQLANWGNHHCTTDADKRARAEELYSGGPEHWNDIMDELRTQHLNTASTD